MCYLPSFLTDVKGFVRFVTNQQCLIKTCVMFIQVFSDMSCTYSFNWKNKNQIYSHMFFYIATTIGNAYMTQKIPMYRSSHRRCSVRKSVVRNFAKFTGKHLCQTLFFNKVSGMRPGTLFKKRLSFTGAFPWILRNF